MNSSDVEKLLQPISPEAPCGPDLEYDAEFGELERSAQGTTEQQFGNTIVGAEPPDWKAVRKNLRSLLDRTKDMRIAVYLARCNLNLDGLLSFQLALQLLRGYVETYWDSLHPELDHSDNDDPTYRTNTLVALCDSATLLRELQDAPLVSSRAMGQFSLRDLVAARDAGEAREDHDGPETAPTMAGIDAAFSDVPLEDIQATEEATRLSAEHVVAIEKYVTEQVGVANAVSLASLQGVLKEMNTFLVSQLERRGVYTGAESDDAVVQVGEAEEPKGSSAFNPNGRIESREQVLKALDSVCEFYERNEPSSPIPLLIRRAKRLASKSFLEILRDLAPDAVSQAEAWGGGGHGSGENSEE